MSEFLGNPETSKPLFISEPTIRKVGETTIRFARALDTEHDPEIFNTVQGEGRNIGTPVVFARLSDCNLQCSWCDTPYTWAFTEKRAEAHDQKQIYDKDAETVRLTVGQAVDRISGETLDRLVITGGEPMMQQKGLVELIKGLREVKPNQWVEIETNGTIAPNEEMLELIDQFNVSPKLANSGNDLKKRRKDKSLETLAKSPKADFKFVSTGEEDLEEILELVERYNIPHHRVFLMPEGRTEPEIVAHQKDLVEICKEHNFNLTTRLHVILWGAKRGV